MDDYKIGEEQKQKITDKQIVYQRLFDTADGQIVLADLQKRCFDKITTYDPDVKKMSLNEGRRSVYVYIVNFLNKDITSIIEELTGKG